MQASPQRTWPFGEHLPFEQDWLVPHVVPSGTGVLWQPWTASQESLVQGLLSLQFGAVPATQAPLPLHVSRPLQTVLSSHGVPAGLLVCAGQALEVPLQVAAFLQAVAGAQTVPAGFFWSVGHWTEVPLQTSSWSQGPAASRQTVPSSSGIETHWLFWQKRSPHGNDPPQVAGSQAAAAPFGTSAARAEATRPVSIHRREAALAKDRTR